MDLTESGFRCGCCGTVVSISAGPLTEQAKTDRIVHLESERDALLALLLQTVKPLHDLATHEHYNGSRKRSKKYFKLIEEIKYRTSGESEGE
jgi:hypothetical protein